MERFQNIANAVMVALLCSTMVISAGLVIGQAVIA